jgi:hypothetical protein
MAVSSRANTTRLAPAARFSRAVLIGAAVLCALSVAFAFQLHRPTAMKVAPAVLGVAFLALLRLGEDARLSVALIVLPTAVTLHGFGFYMARVKAPPAVAAAAAGRPFDSRSKWEIVADMRANGIEVYNVANPKSVLVERDGLALATARVIPLGSVGSVKTVYCNEGGAYSIYDSDERGFNNPAGLWDGPVDVAVLGDSYTQGACVPPDQNFVAHLRVRRPRTINLGMGGNGPLLELAAIREYLSLIKPKVVLWAYFRNDMPDLTVEKRSPTLMRYLDPSFSQGRAAKQADINAGLRVMLDELGPAAPRWPSVLASVGLTRMSTPIWMQDLVMGEDNSAATAVIRHDALTMAAQSRSGDASIPPDFELFGKVLAQARDEVAAWGGTLHFVYIADLYSFGKVNKLHPLYDQVLATARNVGLPIVDTNPAFQALTDVDAIRYHPTSHCSPGGYALIGKVINAHLEAHLP